MCIKIHTHTDHDQPIDNKGNAVRSHTIKKKKKKKKNGGGDFSLSFIVLIYTSQPFIIKFKYHSTMTDDHLEACLKLTTSRNCLDYAIMSDSIQYKSSK